MKQPYSQRQIGNVEGFIRGGEVNVEISKRRLILAINEKNAANIKKYRAEIKERKRLVQFFKKDLERMKRANRKWLRAQKKGKK